MRAVNKLQVKHERAEANTTNTTMRNASLATAATNHCPFNVVRLKMKMVSLSGRMQQLREIFVVFCPETICENFITVDMTKMITTLKLTVGLLLLICSPLSAQFVIDSFDDVTGKACSEHHLTLVEGEEIYVAGASSNSCAVTSFIMRIDASGNELWNTLDAEQSLPLICKMQKIDGALYAIGTVPEDGRYNPHAGDWLVLLRIDMQTGQVLWQTTYEDIKIEKGFLAVFGLESHSDEHIFVNFKQHEQSSTDWHYHGLLFNKVEGEIESVIRGPKSRFAVFASDGNGNVVLTHGNDSGQLTMITDADSDFNDTLWNVNIPENVDGFEIADVFFAGPGRL